MLILTLSAGLMAPALASVSEAIAADDLHTHVHADGTVHTHVKAPASSDERAVRPAKAALHCPGCLTAAECAVSCFGVAVLPAPVSMPPRFLPKEWRSTAVAAPAGGLPYPDLDPPRPVSVQ